MCDVQTVRRRVCCIVLSAVNGVDTGVVIQELTEDILNGFKQARILDDPNQTCPGCSCNEYNEPPPDSLAIDISPQSSEENEERHLHGIEAGVKQCNERDFGAKIHLLLSQDLRGWEQGLSRQAKLVVEGIDLRLPKDGVG